MQMDGACDGLLSGVHYTDLLVKPRRQFSQVVEVDIRDSYMHYLALLYYSMSGTAISPG